MPKIRDFLKASPGFLEGLMKGVEFSQRQALLKEKQRLATEEAGEKAKKEEIDRANKEAIDRAKREKEAVDRGFQDEMQSLANRVGLIKRGALKEYGPSGETLTVGEEVIPELIAKEQPRLLGRYPGKATEIKSGLSLLLPKKEKGTFTPKYIEQTLGNLEAGETSEGFYTEPIDTREDAKLFLLKRFGRNIEESLPPEKVDETEEILRRKYPTSLFPANNKKYQIGQVVNISNKKYKVVGYDTDGEPLVDEVK